MHLPLQIRINVSTPSVPCQPALPESASICFYFKSVRIFAQPPSASSHTGDTFPAFSSLSLPTVTAAICYTKFLLSADSVQLSPVPRFSFRHNHVNKVLDRPKGPILPISRPTRPPSVGAPSRRSLRKPSASPTDPYAPALLLFNVHVRKATQAAQFPLSTACGVARTRRLRRTRGPTYARWWYVHPVWIMEYC